MQQPMAASSNPRSGAGTPTPWKLDSLGRMLYIDGRLSLADNLLLYADKISMAVSLEA